MISEEVRKKWQEAAASEVPCTKGCTDCYWMTYPSGKGPCVGCGEYVRGTRLMKTKPMQPICPECHDNEKLHDWVMEGGLNEET